MTENEDPPTDEKGKEAALSQTYVDRVRVGNGREHFFLASIGKLKLSFLLVDRRNFLLDSERHHERTRVVK